MGRQAYVNEYAVRNNSSAQGNHVAVFTDIDAGDAHDGREAVIIPGKSKRAPII